VGKWSENTRFLMRGCSDGFRKRTFDVFDHSKARSRDGTQQVILAVVRRSAQVASRARLARGCREAEEDRESAKREREGNRDAPRDQRTFTFIRSSRRSSPMSLPSPQPHRATGQGAAGSFLSFFPRWRVAGDADARNRSTMINFQSRLNYAGRLSPIEEASPAGERAVCAT